MTLGLRPRAFPASAGVAAALAAAAALALGGCGGSGLSPAALRSQASRICQRASARESRIATPADLGQARGFLERGAAALAPELTALRRLEAGGRAARPYHRALTQLERELRGLEASAGALRRGADPVIAVKTLQRQLAPVELAADAAWRSLGIAACLNR